MSMSKSGELMTFLDIVAPAEAIIARLSERRSDSSALATAIELVIGALKSLAPADAENMVDATNISDVFEAAVTSDSIPREFAIFALRALDVSGLMPEAGRDATPHFHRNFVLVVQRGLPDLAKHLKLDEVRQTIHKFDLLRPIHQNVVSQLQWFRAVPAGADTFTSSRQESLKILGSSLLKSYLAPYGFSEFAIEVRHVYSEVSALLDTSDTDFGLRLSSAIEHLDKATLAAYERSDFMARDTIVPFFVTASAVLSQIEAESSDRFRCTIRPKRQPPSVVERKFPLHESNRLSRVTIPLLNEGPGVAIDVTVTLVSGTDSVLVHCDTVNIDAVQPGDFAITLDVLVGDPVRTIDLLLEVAWSNARSSARQTASFDVTLQAQDPGVPWEELERSDPYSTDVAQGDEFVGRQAKVLSLSSRLLKPRPQSSYITGQKRVGKTSLALAVRDHVKRNHLPGQSFEFIYLEYGEYARRDADATVEALGVSIATRLQSFLPFEERGQALRFDGSLAPLNSLAQRLFDLDPSRRFVIILDEFDEIHPNMYRYGPLAEAFFSNLRTLSAKPNIALMLVGGENMPFIISAQGDQLNKLIREPLDYFSRSDEWSDFVDLIRLSGASPLNWYESALHEIYRITNGHPYYTKLLCGRIFQAAVSDRDTEVTVEEVQRALLELTETLDTNAFAHFWKDGIPRGREEAEVIELKRRRVLVAVAQVRRQSQPLTGVGISTSARALSVSGPEVLPILTDFARRDILRDRGPEYEFVLPLFEHWLVQKGVSKLIADTLGDEMAEALQTLDDQAFVADAEIHALVDKWPLYRGRSIAVADVRRWLDQCPSLQDRRLLFKLLQSLRFIGEEEARAMLQTAHGIVKRHAIAFTPDTRAQRRFDILVTYVDGPGKSGCRYAARFAEENRISATCVLEQSQLQSAVRESQGKRGVLISTIVIVDDIVATGRSLGGNLSGFLDTYGPFLKDRNISVVAISLLATKEGDEVVRDTLKSYRHLDVDFRACEILADSYYPFSAGSKIWADSDEQARAKALALDLGCKIYKNNPLGFGEMGLTVVFGETCPNNSLPILHAHGRDWVPIFPRPKN